MSLEPYDQDALDIRNLPWSGVSHDSQPAYSLCDEYMQSVLL